VFLEFIQPSVEVLGIRIDEPITTLTDLLFAAVCFFAFFMIRRRNSDERIKWYFKYYFLTLGFGAMTGGILGHAFLYALSPWWKLVSWILILVSVALLAHAMVEMARPLVKPLLTKLASGLNLLVFSVSLIFTLWTLSFSAVEYYTIFGMVAVVGSFSFLIYRKTGSKGMLLLMIGVGVGFLSAVVFGYKWGLSPWFNHNDICHIILMFSAFVLYKGTLLILDSRSSIT
jgi:hypothetical protein